MPSFELLQCNVDLEDEPSEFRILVDGKYVKYLTIDAGLYPPEDMSFGPTLKTILPSLPSGDWNEGNISLDPISGKPHLSRVTKRDLPGIMNIWHSEQNDYLDFKIGHRLHPGVYEASSKKFVSPVVIKFAPFPWEIHRLDRETQVYSWLEGHDIGPAFLGHLTESGRVIGFILEKIPVARHASLADLNQCRQVLTRLHEIGVRHGDVNRHNFLFGDGRIALIDFEVAQKCDDKGALLEELELLEKELEDTSGRGGIVTLSEAWVK